jgi:hypothetical protein
MVHGLGSIIPRQPSRERGDRREVRGLVARLHAVFVLLRSKAVRIVLTHSACSKLATGDLGAAVYLVEGSSVRECEAWPERSLYSR